MHAPTTLDTPRHDFSVTPYTPSKISALITLLTMALAGLGGGLLSFVVWLVLKHTNLPAFGGSLVSRALTTAVMVVIVLSVAATLVWVEVRNRNYRPLGNWTNILVSSICMLSPAALVTAALAIPLSATRLYLDGIAVDQGFRTQYLTRLTHTWHLHDMNYADLPAYYPAGWFWWGGRFASFLGLSGWEAFQPWSLVTLSAAAAMLVPVWQRITGSLSVATAIGLVSTSLMLVMNAEEPYAAIIAMGAPAALILGRRGVLGGKFAALGCAVFLGLSASMYTLYTAVLALSVVLLAVVSAIFHVRSWMPLLRLLAIGLSSLAIASIVWAPYLLAVVSGDHQSGATATHYLPIQGTQLPFPMLAASGVGILCMIGVFYLIARYSDPDARALNLGILVTYLWIFSSMMATLAGTTLLGFRLDILVTMMLATAGVLGIAEFRLVGIHRFYPAQFSERTSTIVTVTLAIILACFGLKYVQDIPNRNAHAIDLAYTSTDGSGHRADLYPPDAGVYYQAIDAEIRSHGYSPENTIVLSSEKNFMSYYPYYGFQALTSHYANPLGEFDLRNKAIESWADGSWRELKSADSFLAKLDSEPWPAPNVFILRGNLEAPAPSAEEAAAELADSGSTSAASSSGSTGWNYDLAEDIYPNNPNVRFRGVMFNPAVFDSQHFTRKQIGPFVVITRVSQ